MKISEQLVQMYSPFEYDKSVLINEASPVNIRLYKLGKQYKDIILEIVKYMDEHLNEKFEDWKEPIGVAASHLGIPLCIIGYKYSMTGNSKFQYCINPKITGYLGAEVPAQGNCGTLQLKEPVSILRYSLIDFEYYDLDGNLASKRSVSRMDGGYCVQNLIDSINGISVEERKKLGVAKRIPINFNQSTSSDICGG